MTSSASDKPEASGADGNRIYERLDPDTIFRCLEAGGLFCSGHLQALNSYENRVYQVGIEDDNDVIAKFYRPGRWSDAQILEEHAFSQELADADLPAVAPLRHADGRTLLTVDAFRFSLYPRQGGRSPHLDDPHQLKRIGRLLARLHNVSAVADFEARPALTLERFGTDAVTSLLESGFIPADVEGAYRAITTQLIDTIDDIFHRVGPVELLRLHGDCHPGNLLWSRDVPHLVDFDDAQTGPAIQDLWMFLSGEGDYLAARLENLLDGYQQFRDFEAAELRLIEPLRALRMIHYAAWIAGRWDDGAFPQAFPWFNTRTYWDKHVLDLKEQAAALLEPPLQMP